MKIEITKVCNQSNKSIPLHVFFRFNLCIFKNLVRSSLRKLDSLRTLLEFGCYLIKKFLIKIKQKTVKFFEVSLLKNIQIKLID